MAELFDEQGNFLTSTPGLGLASAPGTQLAESGLDFGGPSDVSMASPSMPSLNFAASPRTQSDQDYLQNLPTSQKIGLALQAFAAGVAGHPSPIDAMLKERRAQLAADRADLHETINVIQKGTEVLRKMPPGIARDAVASELGKALGGGPFTDLFKAAGDQHQDIKDVLDTFSDSDVQNKVLKTCTGSADFRLCAMKLHENKTFMDEAHATADDNRWGGIVKILRPAIDQAKKQGLLDEYKQSDGSYKIPESALGEFNDKAKLFTPEQMATIRRRPERLVPYGIVTDKNAAAAQKVGLEEAARQAEKPASEKQPQTIDVGGVKYQFDPDKTLDGPRLQSDPRYAALGPSKGKDEKPEKDTAKAERDRILLKISRGGQPDANEQKFMEAYAKTDPFKAAIGEAIAGALGSKESAAAPGGTAAPAVSDADQRIIAARRKVAGLTEEPKDAVGRAAWRLAGNKLSSETAAPGAEKAATATAVKSKFAADTSMTGNTLGKETPNGFEVFDKKKKLIGYYR